jgi:hypothetical protein
LYKACYCFSRNLAAILGNPGRRELSLFPPVLISDNTQPRNLNKITKISYLVGHYWAARAVHRFTTRNLIRCASPAIQTECDSALDVCEIKSVDQVLDQHLTRPDEEEQEVSEHKATFLDALKGLESARKYV